MVTSLWLLLGFNQKIKKNILTAVISSKVKWRTYFIGNFFYSIGSRKRLSNNLFSFDDFYFEASLVTNLILIILLSYVLFDFNLDNLGIYLIRSILVQSCKPKKNKSKNRLKSRLATDLVLIIHTTIFSLRAVRWELSSIC